MSLLLFAGIICSLCEAMTILTRRFYSLMGYIYSNLLFSLCQKLVLICTEMSFMFFIHGKFFQVVSYFLLLVGVDPSQGMLDVFRKETDSNPNVETVCMDTVTFSQSTQYSPYDRIFLKDMVHLLTRKERLIAFEGFYKQLALNNGKLLMVYGSIDGEIFPFDERTKSLFRKGNDLETLFDELKHAGFNQIQQEIFTFEYPLNSVQAEDWIYLIENRLWTLFSKENKNEQQMKDLIDHVRRQYESPNNFQTIDTRTIIKSSVE